MGLGVPLQYVPLTNVQPQNGLLSVMLGALENAGFHPLIECDPRGWMYFYGWPLGSWRTVTVWIPQGESADATAFLAAPSVLPWEPSDDEPGNWWAGISSHRRLIYASWLIGEAGAGSSLVVVACLYAVADRPDTINGEPY